MTDNDKALLTRLWRQYPWAAGVYDVLAGWGLSDAQITALLNRLKTYFRNQALAQRDAAQAEADALQ